jgi:hypothetical protein
MIKKEDEDEKVEHPELIRKRNESANLMKKDKKQ